MKKIVCTGLMLFALASFSFGQNLLKEYGYSVYGGVSLSSLEKDTVSSSSIPGFHLGVAVEIPVSGRFSIQPGVELSLKGAKINRWKITGVKEITLMDSENNPYTQIVPDTATAIFQRGVTERLLYLQMPILAYYHFEVGSGKFFVAGGPYGACGVYSRASEKDEEDRRAWFYATEYGKFDLGLQLKAGYELPSGWFFSLGYDMGLLNIANNGLYNDKAKNRSILFTIGRKVWGN